MNFWGPHSLVLLMRDGFDWQDAVLVGLLVASLLVVVAVMLARSIG